MGPVFLDAHRNKHSLVLDLQQVEGLALLQRLLAEPTCWSTDPAPMAT